MFKSFNCLTNKKADWSLRAQRAGDKAVINWTGSRTGRAGADMLAMFDDV